jgi:hypothetical protein
VNRQAEARFTREAMATGKLDHPHVVSAIDYGQLPDGRAYLVTALVRGESLAKPAARGPLKIGGGVPARAQVADALVAAHAAGIVHRDLKPDNILLETRDDGSLHAKVVDFGVARMTEVDAGGDAALPITRMGAVIGTPGYMAPEQATGGTVDARVDLYALGVILWECCAGQPLWDTESVSQLTIAQLTRQPPNLYPDVAPRELAGLIAQLLARPVEQRPATALVVRDELRRQVRELRTEQVAPTPAVSGRTVAAPTGPNANGAPTAADRPATGSRTMLWIAAAVVLVVVLAIVAGGEEAPTSEPARTGTIAAQSGPPTVKRSGEKRELASRRDLLKDLPEEFAEHGRALLLSTSREERAAAGAAMTAAEGRDRAKIPAYFLQIAAFETAEDCEGRRSILREIAAADDVRVVWALRSWLEQPTNECRGRDCLGCLRADLKRVAGEFEATVAE